VRNVCEEEVEKEERLLKSKFGAEKKDSIFFRETKIRLIPCDWSYLLDVRKNRFL
jgi:hypothetical protein